MVIHRLLQEASFDPKEIGRMVAAYEAALRIVQLADRNAPITDLIAKKIIDVGRSGERDPDRICALALSELGLPVKG